MLYIYGYEHFMDIMNVLRTGMNMPISHIHVRLYYITCMLSYSCWKGRVR